MSIIFLDHYGVMVLANKSLNIKRDYTSLPLPIELRNAKIPNDFNIDAVKILNKILNITDAEIVITSDWKERMTLTEICKFYNDQGVIRSPIGYTKSIIDKNLTIHQRRALEISNYINRNNIEKWVAIDDLYMGNDLNNFVWCQHPSDGIVNKIDEILLLLK